jgi:DnaK suppressor protein
MLRKDALKEMRKILMTRRNALRQAIAGDDSLLRELSQNKGGDEIDFALDCAHGEINSQLAEVESRELASIENALAKMDENRYGVCEACDCSIPLSRLRALPYATYCIDCKRKAEQAGVEPGSVVDWSAILERDRDDLRMNDLDFNIS